jgi:hypothetical protein
VNRNRREFSFTEYEIFCGGRIEWAPRDTDVNTLVPAGRDINGSTTYICQAIYQDGAEQVFTGTYSTVTRDCITVARGELERKHTDFKLLRSL